MITSVEVLVLVRVTVTMVKSCGTLKVLKFKKFTCQALITHYYTAEIIITVLVQNKAY